MSFRSHAIQSLGVHELVGVPEDLVVVEVGGGVEPEVQPLLPVAAAVDEDVGLEGDGHAGLVAEELEVHLVAAAIFRLRDELEKAHACMTLANFDRRVWNFGSIDQEVKDRETKQDASWRSSRRRL
jgi:hypothetical protein